MSVLAVSRNRSSTIAANEAMERYAAGDELAFQALYESVVPRLYGFLLRRTRDPELAEDLVQQTLLQVHRARNSFIPGAEVLPWIMAIARRLAIDHARSVNALFLRTRHFEATVLRSKAAPADEILEARQLAARLEEKLANLPEPQRVAFELMKTRDLSLVEAADLLHITVGALKLRLHRAQANLRALVLDGHEES